MSGSTAAPGGPLPVAGPSIDEAIARQGALYRAAVTEHIAPGEPYALAGFPDHSNSGDAAIYLGELALFDELGCPIRYVCSMHNDGPDLAVHHPDGTIFLHGGGNFGDLYRENDLRMRMIERYRGRRIVQLPQSIHFTHPENVDKMARVVARHGDVHLMVRDIPSFEFATAHFDCAVRLVPDAAFYLGRLAPSGRPVHRILSVQRADKERATDAVSAYLASLGPVRDWSGRTAPLAHFSWVARKQVRDRLTSYRSRVAADVTFRAAAYEKMARERLAVAVGILSSAEIIVSDRLHAHIISSLLRKPHISLDNSYGKIANYMGAWGNDGLALRAGGLDDLKRAVEVLRSRGAIPIEAGHRAPLVRTTVPGPTERETQE